MIKQRLRDMCGTVASALREPTGKQKEAYGRLSHTLCAAAFIGLLSFMFSNPPAEGVWYHYLKAIALLVMGIILLLVGAILSKGD